MKQCYAGLVALIMVVTTTVHAGSCHGHFFNPVTDVCWECLMPITIGRVPLATTSLPDTENPISPICACGDPIPRVGFTLGFWEPVRMVDVTTTPFCFVNLGGFQVHAKTSFRGMVESRDEGEMQSSFYHLHWYQLPLLSWFGVLTDTACLDHGDFDIPLLTELSLSWNDDTWHFINNPEAALFSAPLAQLACGVDATKATKGLPINQLFWCAGSQGSMYPVTGFVQGHVGGVQASTLLVERATFSAHRKLLMFDTSRDLKSICHAHPAPMLRKTRYRYQMINPSSSSCYPFGHSTAVWGSHREVPSAGQNYGYIVWRKRNCCVL